MMPMYFTPLLRRRFTALAAFALVVGCADGRPGRRQVQLFTVTPPPPTTLELVADRRFGEASTEVLQMSAKGNSLFMTGRPFGFMRWEIGANPENPSLTFAASQQIDTFTPMGSWVVDWYSSGALSLFGGVALLSGTVGSSVINLLETHRPVETFRYPALDPNSNVIPADEAFVYAASAVHPTMPLMYGFRRQDFVYSVGLGNNGSMTLLARDAYGSPGESVCCVRGATVFAGKVYVAFTDRLIFFDLGANGALQNTQESLELNAVNVASTDRYLYVQHKPLSSQPMGMKYPSGFYVFNTQGQNVAYFSDGGSFRRFAVSSNDTHMFANVDGTKVNIYRILWTR